MQFCIFPFKMIASINLILRSVPKSISSVKQIPTFNLLSVCCQLDPAIYTYLHLMSTENCNISILRDQIFVDISQRYNAMADRPVREIPLSPFNS